MIKFKNIEKSEPYEQFSNFYEKALTRNQDFPYSFCISSYDKNSEEVDSRFVNLKYIIENEWVFFSNYNSKKANSFETHNQIAANFFWSSIFVQIRIKGKIFKTNKDFSDKHFKNRKLEKNALAISSDQSAPIESFSMVKKKYLEELSSKESLKKRPNYWGGFSFIPYYFEFWEGDQNRLNKRTSFIQDGKSWKKIFLQP